MNIGPILPYLVGALSIVGVLIVGYLLSKIFKKESQTETLDRQLAMLLEGEDEFYDEKDFIPKGENERRSLPEKWNHFWGTHLKDAGFARYERAPVEKAGRDVLVATVLIALIVSIVTMNPLIGVGIAGITLFAASSGVKALVGRQQDKMEGLLPGFLAALKSRIQASDTAEQGFLKVAPDMPSPLREELDIPRRRLMAGESFETSFRELHGKTNSEELRFLAACFIVAKRSGANIQDQIDAIQESLKNRKRVTHEINRAVKATKPAVILSTLVIPGMFVFSWLSSEDAKNYWFVNPWSYAVLAGVVALYFTALHVCRKQADRIRNM